MPALNPKFAAKSSGMPDPASGVVAINVAAADQVLAVDTRYILITTAGNLAIQCPDGTSATIPLPLGFFPIGVRKVRKTGTTAAGFLFY